MNTGNWEGAVDYTKRLHTRVQVILSAAYVREFIFQNEAFLENYTKSLRGPWYIKDKTVNEDGSVHAVIVSSYNTSPLWGGEGDG